MRLKLSSLKTSITPDSCVFLNYEWFVRRNPQHTPICISGRWTPNSWKQKSMDDRAGNVSNKSLWQCAELALLSMEEILHHLGCIKPCKEWDIRSINWPINWCRISSINIISLFGVQGAVPSNFHQHVSDSNIIHLTWLVGEFKWSGTMWVKQQCSWRKKKQCAWNCQACYTALVEVYLLEKCLKPFCEWPVIFPRSPVSGHVEINKKVSIKFHVESLPEEKIPYNIHNIHN